MGQHNEFELTTEVSFETHDKKAKKLSLCHPGSFDPSNKNHSDEAIFNIIQTNQGYKGSLTKLA